MSKKMQPCKTCGTEIAISAKKCPHCGGKNKKPFYQKWWFWFVIILILIGALSSGDTSPTTSSTEPSESAIIADTPSPTDNHAQTASSNEETPTQSASTDLVDNLTNEIGEAIENVSETMGQTNALKSAKNYLNTMPFSHDGLIAQLEFEGYSTEDATYAADNCGADWNEQALKSAKNYLNMMAFSYSGLITQLEFENYTTEEATYAADTCGADWNEQAAKSAKNYLDMMAFSRDSLINQLEFEGFTHEQAVYGAEANGYTE